MLTRAHRFWNLERGLLVFFLAVAVVQWTLAQGYVRDAKLFPEIISAAVAILSAYVLVVQTIQWWRGTEPEAGKAEKPALNWLLTLSLTVGLMLLYYAFGLGTGILVFTVVLARMMGQKWPNAIVLGVVLSFVLWYAFGSLLRIPLPRGLILPLF